MFQFTLISCVSFVISMYSPFLLVEEVHKLLMVYHLWFENKPPLLGLSFVSTIVVEELITHKCFRRFRFFLFDIEMSSLYVIFSWCDHGIRLWGTLGSCNISIYSGVSDYTGQSGMPHLIIAFVFHDSFLTLCFPCLFYLSQYTHYKLLYIAQVTTNTADDTMIAIISSWESSKLELLSTVTEGQPFSLSSESTNLTVASHSSMTMPFTAPDPLAIYDIFLKQKILGPFNNCSRNQWSIMWYQYFIYRVRFIPCCMFVKWDHATLDPTAKWHVVISHYCS